MKVQTNYDVIKKLVGEIRPVGETWADEERLENLKEHIELVGRLVSDLIKVSGFKDRDERSIHWIGRTAYDFLEKLSKDINEAVGYEADYAELEEVRRAYAGTLDNTLAENRQLKADIEGKNKTIADLRIMNEELNEYVGAEARRRMGL